MRLIFHGPNPHKNAILNDKSNRQAWRNFFAYLPAEGVFVKEKACTIPSQSAPIHGVSGQVVEGPVMEVERLFDNPKLFSRFGGRGKR
jgi:hypothetical protein